MLSIGFWFFVKVFSSNPKKVPNIIPHLFFVFFVFILTFFDFFFMLTFSIHFFFFLFLTTGVDVPRSL